MRLIGRENEFDFSLSNNEIMFIRWEIEDREKENKIRDVWEEHRMWEHLLRL